MLSLTLVGQTLGVVELGTSFINADCHVEIFVCFVKILRIKVHITPIEVIFSVLAFDCLNREVIHSQRIRVLVLVVVGQAAVVIVERKVLLVVTFTRFTDCQLLVLDCLFVVGDRIRQLHRFVQTQAKVIQALWFLRL